MQDESDSYDVTPTTVSGQPDPLFQQLYGGGTGSGMADRQVGFPTVPPFNYYVLKPVGANADRTEWQVRCRAIFQVIEGPPDTPGKKFTDSGGILFLVPKEFEKKDGTKVVLSEKEFQTRLQAKKDQLNRIKYALGLALAIPPGSFTDEALQAYAAQFQAAQTFVARVWIEVGKDGIGRNRIDWGSVAKLDEPVKDANGKLTGQTAVEQARKTIAEYRPGGGGAKAARQPGTSTASLNPGDLS